MENLALEIFDIDGSGGSKYANLPGNTTFTIIETSEIFASGDIWSHSFTLNTYANAHIFGAAGDIHGGRLHDLINKRRARLWIMGLPLYLGYLKLDDEVDVDKAGNVDVSFEGGQKTFEEMIEGAKANQVPMIGDVQIGMALWRKRKIRYEVKLTAAVTLKAPSGAEFVYSGDVYHDNQDKTFIFSYDGEEEGNSVQQYPRMVFPNGSFSGGGQQESANHINTDAAYSESGDGVPTNPYCNVPLCYQRYGYERKDQYGNVKPDYSSEPEAQRGYEYMPANRVNSAPNFFVLYWIRALMNHLGIHIDENQMLEVEDLRRLFFVNTNCAYEEPTNLNGDNYTRYGRFTYDSHGEGRIIPEYINSKKNINIEESGFSGKDVEIISGGSGDLNDKVSITIREIKEWDDFEKTSYENANSYFHRAFATSECFPDADISEVIKAIESGFGVRFLFSEGYKRVRIVLLKNLFRSTEVQTVICDIISDSKTENCIRGFKMTYGDSKDTHFYYKGFADMLPHKKPYFVDKSDKHDYSYWNLNAEYPNIINKVSAFVKTCYVTPNTGDAYGIKIDKDAKRYDELHPAMFEFAGFMDAEDGDCTGEEETIETINVGFKPAIMNDLNMEEERAGSTKQRFALFADETMRPRRCNYNDQKDRDYFNDPQKVYDIDKLYAAGSPAADMMAGDGIVKPGEFAIMSDMYAYYDKPNNKAVARVVLDRFLVHDDITIAFNFEGHIHEGYRLYLQDNYEPNDDGVCPIEKHDWGLTLGIMRGSGSDADVNYSYDPDDHEGNDTWELVPGSGVVSHPDICDNFGKIFDYTANGQEDEQDTEGRFSLKLRAEKLNPYYDPTSTDASKKNQYLEISDKKLRKRGLIDVFYKEYSYWIRNARIAKRTVRMEMAQFLAIDKTKKVTVGDVTGFVRKMQFTVSDAEGMGNVTMEIMYI